MALSVRLGWGICTCLQDNSKKAWDSCSWRPPNCGPRCLQPLLLLSGSRLAGLGMASQLQPHANGTRGPSPSVRKSASSNSIACPANGRCAATLRDAWPCRCPCPLGELKTGGSVRNTWNSTFNRRSSGRNSLHLGPRCAGCQRLCTGCARIGAKSFSFFVIAHSITRRRPVRRRFLFVCSPIPFVGLHYRPSAQAAPLTRERTCRLRVGCGPIETIPIHADVPPVRARDPGCFDVTNASTT